MPGYVNVVQLSNYLNVDVEKIRRLNPSLRKPVYRAEKYIPEGFQLRLPPETSQRKKLIIAGLPSELVRSKQKRSRFHRVDRGDTAGKIARLHSVSIGELVRANNLNSRATIYVGQNLIIPGSSRTVEAASAKNTLKKAVAVKEAVPEEPSPKISLEKPSSTIETEVKINPQVILGNFEVEQEKKQKGSHTGVIRVAVAETLGHYADWLQTPVRSIRRLNGLRYGQVLRLHQKVKIPLSRTSKAEFEEKRIEYHQELVEDFFNVYRVDQTQTYHIKTGDNIWTLCKDVFEIPLWLFLTYNEGLDLNELKTSQRVKIPVVEKTAASTG